MCEPVHVDALSEEARAVFGVEKFKKVTPPPLDLGVAGRTRVAREAGAPACGTA